jgi:hypothetical protein
MAGKPIGQRVDRLEQVLQIIAEDQVSLQKLIADLARETSKRFDRVAKQFEESDRKMREMDKKFDERIDKLVVAMGEFIRQQNATRK